MTDSQSADDDANEPEPRDEIRSLTPFILAAAIAAIVLAVIVIAEFVTPAEKNVTESDRIAAGVQRFAEASSRYGLEPPEDAVCPDFDPARSPLAGRLVAGESGKSVEITDLTAPTAQGDTGTANVTSKVDGQEATATWNLVRSGDRWLVCSQPVR
ncbi:hypothetical protein B0T36_19065 [Nocardia donostiensis]|uniref:Rv0361 family membrane protein n=1 Tax=Nocardia donostiensis TaxID=1538463 RepID=UPI0009D9E6C5|nr:hypothetical protein [Nocardia donostiensis]OQS13509.1 hypothetical protein B0T36_19065 [Nocardia donostiensis]